MDLTERDIQYGFDYYHKDDPDKAKAVVEVSEFAGEERLVINCTQLGDSFTPQFSSAKEKKRVLNEWCEFLIQNPGQFTELSFGTRMPQELFDAVCCQKNLVKLDIKWGVYKDLSNIEKLQNLQLLRFGSGAGVQSILPLTGLRCLIGLSIENFQKITDYSPLKKLTSLESLSVCGDGTSPQYIKIESLDFLKEMAQLRYLRILTARLQSKDYSPVLGLRNLEYLSLRSERNVKKLFAELSALPKLKWGLLKERPDLYG